MKHAQDEKYIMMALAEAQKGLGRTHPNPAVGAVVVLGRRIVGKGFHSKAGKPHAEAIALRRAGTKTKGATLYSTLEPCNHIGRTPACTEAIIAAGIQRVVYASPDPNPLVNGKGRKRLLSAGLEVVPHVLRAKADAMNRPFITAMTLKRPWVTLKAAITLDGKLATATYQSKWITSPLARREGHRLRNRCDAIVVGAHTVQIDDPALTARIPGGRSPVRIVIDPKLVTNPQATIYSKEDRVRRIVISTHTHIARAQKFEARGIEVWPVPLGEEGIDLPHLMNRLLQEGLLHILLEGGSRMIEGFLRADLVDEIVLFVAPKLFGDPGLTWTGRLGVTDPTRAIMLEGLEARLLGSDLMLTARVLRTTTFR